MGAPCIEARSGEMTETAESVWNLAVQEPEISLEEAIDNMSRSERDELKRNAERVFHAIRTKEILEEYQLERRD